MISKQVAIDIIRELYKSENGLLTYTLYTRFKMSAVDMVLFVNHYLEKGLIQVDDELRVSLTDGGRHYALGIINQHRGDNKSSESQYFKEVQSNWIGKFDPYIPNKDFIKKFKKQRENGKTETSS